MYKRFISTDAPSAVFIIRLIVGLVFFTEGIQKFLFPDALGVGRFIKIGIPFPEFFAPFVGVVEIVFPLFLFFGLLTRFASIPLLINISVAILSTKIPILLNKGFWPAMHESRVDLCMFFGLIFLLIVGAGKWSLDHKMTSEKRITARDELKNMQ